MQHGRYKQIPHEGKKKRPNFDSVGAGHWQKDKTKRASSSYSYVSKTVLQSSYIVAQDTICEHSIRWHKSKNAHKAANILKTEPMPNTPTGQGIKQGEI